MAVKRYDWDITEQYVETGKMEEVAGGEYVKPEDYAKLKDLILGYVIATQTGNAELVEEHFNRLVEAIREADDDS